MARKAAKMCTILTERDLPGVCIDLDVLYREDSGSSEDSVVFSEGDNDAFVTAQSQPIVSVWVSPSYYGHWPGVHCPFNLSGQESR
jgi:hypothetical protein